MGNQGAVRAAAPRQVQRQCRECEEKEKASGAGLVQRQCRECEEAAETRIQPRLKVGSVDDPLEREADQTAERVIRGAAGEVSAAAPPSPQRAPTGAGDASRSQATGGETTLSAGQLTAGGTPLTTPVRSFFEGSFGRDFSDVRVHAGDDAARYNDQLDARAFTYDRHIWLGRSERPDTSKLMAHERTHVVQQTGAGRRDAGSVRRQPYETRGIDLDRSDVTSLAATSYWEQRTLAAFDTAFHSRLTADPEERDAVLAALWAMNPPTTVTAASTMFVHVPARTIPAAAGGSPTQAPELLYSVTFGPPAAGDPRPVLTFEFVASGAPVTVPAAPADYVPGTHALSSQGFGSGGHAAYFTAHPEHHRALFHWLENSAPASFDQVVTTATASHTSVIHASGSRSGSTLSNLDLELLSQTALGAAQTLPADYRERDGADLELDRLRANTTAADRLGAITLPPNLAADERTAVKYAIWQYFEAGSARNTEVDAIVPVGSGSRTVLYTVVFGTNNDVVVTRIGETGTGTGQVDADRIDVTRVRGFPATATTTSALRTWWAARYPQGGTLTPDPPAPAQGQPATPAPTTAALIGEMSQLIETGIRNRTWFGNNYSIEVLDAGPLATRLQDPQIHNVPGPPVDPSDPPDLTDDTENFTRTDLRMLELSLQTLTDDELGHLSGVKVGRKTGSIERHGNTYQTGSAGQYGITLMDNRRGNREITVLFFQALYDNNDRLFRGSAAANVLPNVTMRFLHELGHATGHDAGIEAAFNTWIAGHPQAAPTWYAASNPAVELFPEAFALYHTDPHFLCTSAPRLYAWFDVLATTGSPPPGHPAAPSSCP